MALKNNIHLNSRNQNTINVFYLSIFHSINDAILILNKKGEIIDANKTATKLLRKSFSALKKTPLTSIFIRDNSNNCFKLLQAIKSSKNNFHCKNFITVNKVIYFPASIELTKFVSEFDSKNYFIMEIKDISNQIINEVKERNLIISAQEEERCRLSADLHDSLGQEINAVKTYVAVMGKMNSNEPQFKEAIDECTTILLKATKLISELCFNLMPKSLEKGNLLYAIEELVVKLSKVYKVKYNFPNFDIKLSKENQVNLFRIIQEFISNSIKHSECNTITIYIQETSKGLVIKLKDDGKGFNIKTIKKGNGIYNIQSRLISIQTEYKFISTKNKGTELVIKFSDQKNKNTNSRRSQSSS